MSRNKIERIDLKQILDSLPSLEVLNLSQNFITNLQKAPVQFENESLRKLILSRNRLLKMDDFKSMRFVNLKILTLFGNWMEYPSGSKGQTSEVI